MIQKQTCIDIISFIHFENQNSRTTQTESLSYAMKEIAKLYKVSYPTVRLRLDKLIQKNLSARRVWQLGVVVPLLSFATMITLYFVMQVSQTVNYIVVSAILLALELLILDRRAASVPQRGTYENESKRY